MSHFLDKATQKVKKKASQVLDRLRPTTRPAGHAPPQPSQRNGPSITSYPKVELNPSGSTPVVVSLASSEFQSVSTTSTYSACLVAAGPATPPAEHPIPPIPEYARAPPSPTILATTGSAIKGLLVAARNGSDLLLPIKAALVGVVALWDIADRTAEAKAEFTKLESKLKAIDSIAASHGNEVDPSLQARLGEIVEAIRSLWEVVEQRQARGRVARVAQSAIDLDDVKSLNTAMSSLVELFQFEGGIAIEKELGLISKRFDVGDSERHERERVKTQRKTVKIIKTVLGDNLGSGAADHEQPSNAGCMAGTRVGVLSKFMKWARKDPKAILWLAGMAGTGKTSIAVSLCRMLRDDPAVFFGGGYFCSRTAGSATRTDVRRILPMLAALLASKSQDFATALAMQLEKDQHVCHKPVGEQLDTLLHSPLAEIVASTRPIVFVIDALDECKDEHELDELLRLLADLPCNGKLKFILTSRPELHIRGTPISNSAHSTILQLHTLDIEEVTSDIRQYIRSTLHGAVPGATWYTNQDVELLVMLSGGLFIFASTVLKYVLQRTEDDDRRDRLQKATSAVATRNAATSALDEVYEFVLVDASRSDFVDEDELERTRSILACILTARTPLSVDALAVLMDMTPGRLRGALDRMHSLVCLPSDDREPALQTLHASFGDYLFGRAPTHIRIAPTMGHDLLARGCMKRMSLKDLCFNVARSQSSFRSNPKCMPHRIELSLAYACLHWAHHIAAASDRTNFSSDVYQILRIKFLFWLEVLSVLEQTSLASGLLRIADSAVSEPVVSQFLRDADVFVASSHEAISRSAPHIYLSALPFAAKDSLIYRYFAPFCSGVVFVTTSGIDRHGGRLVTTLTGHEKTVRSVAYSSDGSYLVSGSDDSTVRIWDTRTGAEITKILHSDGPVSSVAVSPNGQHVVSGTDGGGLYVWSVPTGRIALHPLRGHVDAISSVAYSRDGTLIASSSMDKTVCLWSAETGRRVFTLIGHINGVSAIAFSTTGNLLASASDDKTIRLWDPHSGNAVGTPLTDFCFAVRYLSFSPDDKWLAAGSMDTRVVRIWDLATQQPTPVAIFNHSRVASLAFSPTGSMLITSGRSTIQCWDPQSGRELHATLFTGHSDWVLSLAFSFDGKSLASSSADRTIRIWDLVGGDESRDQLMLGHNGKVSSVAVSVDGSSIVSGSYSRSVCVWDAHTGETRFQPLLGHRDLVLAVVISPPGHLIASASADHTVRLWDMHTGESVGEPICGHADWVYAVAFSPDTQWLATGSRDKTVCVWDVASGNLAKYGRLRCTDIVYAVTFSPDGRLLVAADNGGYVHVWRSGTAEPARAPLKANSKGIYCLTFSPDSTLVVTGGYDNAIRIWSIVDGHQIALLNGHVEVVCSVRYSPDGRYIVSASNDKTVRLWDSHIGSAAVVLHGHGDMVESVRFTPDGRSIVSGSADATIHIWDVEEALLLAQRAEKDPLARLSSAALQDGWLVGAAGELLLWVPAQYRGHIQLPPCTMIIGSHRVSLTINDAVHWGDQWTQCWSDAVHPAVTPSP